MIADVVQFALEMALGAFISFAVIGAVMSILVAFEAAMQWLDDRNSRAAELARIDAERARAIAEIRETTNWTLSQLDDMYRSRVIDGTAQEIQRW